MKRTTGLLTFCVLSLMMAAAITAFADIARPKPSPANMPKQVMNTGMEIVPDAKVYQAHIQISQSAVAELRDALNAGTTSSSFTQRIANSPASTIVAGLLLFMSVSFAGVWFARSAGSRSQKAAAAVLISVAMLGAAAIITRANAGPPPGYLWRNLPKNLNAGKSTSGGVIVEIVSDEGAAIKVIIPLKQNPGGNGDE